MTRSLAWSSLAMSVVLKARDVAALRDALAAGEEK